VRAAIADPDVRWLELGALHRTIKQGSLAATPHAVSCYVRVKSRLLASMLNWATQRWFTLQRLERSGLLHDM
jgi:hypothetical protein